MIAVMSAIEIENVINEHNQKVQAERNRMLRARLARPCTSEELLVRLGGLADCLLGHEEVKIPLTNISTQYIMEATR